MKRKQFLPEVQGGVRRRRRSAERGPDEVSTKKTQPLRSVKTKSRHPGTGGAARAVAAVAARAARESENGLVPPRGAQNGSGDGASEGGASRDPEALAGVRLEEHPEGGDRRAAEEEESSGSLPGVDSSVFLDEDSNQIMPVGHIFGNLDLVQDYPPRNPTRAPVNRREYRRLHFIAKEDEDEDAATDDDGSLSTEQQKVYYRKITPESPTPPHRRYVNGKLHKKWEQMRGVKRCSKNCKNGLLKVS
ncbi:UPF0688 protein C1orf174 homolog isoform X2 [Scleropages formosus]|uniref:UPF0688 protein C1orf174 homolog isoform X2 n=1 Tax=Scleropages formosus TaxID=113540 RepID=UPI0010FABBC2|nr:UPF0688 protein C1orf174 homolog isoform X2 [Scleropages formosus]